MASRTQMRLAQLTGSFGDAPEQISDQRPEQSSIANASALLMSSGSLLGPLSEMASAIRRIHGADQFAKSTPGQFHVDIMPSTDNQRNLGSPALKFANVHSTKIFLAGDEINALDSVIAGSYADHKSVPSAKAIKDYVDAQDHDDDLSIAGDSGTGTVDLDNQSITISGGTGLTSAAAGQTVTIALDDTAVTPDSYGSTLVGDFTIPKFTVDAQGRITAASEKIIQNATVSLKGVASFAAADFDVALGAVSIKDDSIVQDYIAANAVGPTELAQTAVTAADYGVLADDDKRATFSVDAQGRLTAAGNRLINIAHTQVNDFDDGVRTNKVHELATPTANFSMGNNKISDLLDPVSAQDAATKAYVDAEITSQDLDIGADSGSGVVDLDSQTLILSGTLNEITTSASGQVITVGLPADVTISGDLTVSANLIVNGEQFKIDGETVVMNDTLMEMGTQGASNLPPTGSTTKDLGLLLHRWDNTANAAKLQFMGWDESALKFIMRSGVTEAGGILDNLGSAAALEVGAFTAAASSVSTLGTSGLATLASATVTGNSDFQGDVNLGGEAADDVLFNGSLANSILPKTNNTPDLGSASFKFRTIYAGTSMVTAALFADTLGAPLDANNQGITNINIDTGTIDGATIATSDITVGTGKTLDVSDGTLTLADNQISGDKVEGGTIAAITISSLVATTADINGGTIDGASIGATVRQSGAFTDLDCTDKAFAITNLAIAGAVDAVTVGAGDEFIISDAGDSGNGKRVSIEAIQTFLAASGTQKVVYEVASAAVPEEALDIGAQFAVAADWHDAAAASQEVYCNGQLLYMGTSAGDKNDWYKSATVSGEVHFVFALEPDDIIQFILRA